MTTTHRQIAALYVQARGVYTTDPTIDPWPESRDARRYRGPHPVIAHPPCTRWCRLAGLVEARWGHRRGDDGGTFASALASVRAYGGVLEHPAHTDAWAAYELAPPPPRGGWSEPDAHGGRTCHVEQRAYGHPARKATWLYAVATDYPELDWSRGASTAVVSWCGNRPGYGHSGPGRDTRPRLGARDANATPPAFRELLLALARSVTRPPQPRRPVCRIRPPTQPTIPDPGAHRLRSAAHRHLLPQTNDHP